MEILQNEILILKSQDNENNNLPDNYVTLLQQNNYKTGFVKVLVFENINLDNLREKLEHPQQYKGLIFTSPRSIQATNEALNQKPLAKDWHTKQNFVIGEKSKKLALDLLNLQCCGENSGNALKLSEEIINTQNVGDTLPFLFPCGNIKRDVLKTELLKQNISLEEVTVYETKPNPKIEEELGNVTDKLRKFPEIFVYFSPSGVQSTKEVVERLRLEQKLKFIAIGPTTAEAIEKNGWPLCGFAEKPTPESLLEVIRSIQ